MVDMVWGCPFRQIQPDPAGEPHEPQLLLSVCKSAQYPLQSDREPVHCVSVPKAESPDPPEDPAPLAGFEDDEPLGSTKKTTAAMMTITATMAMMIFGVNAKPAAAGGAGGAWGICGVGERG